LDDVTPFDLQRMFLGENFDVLLLAEIAFRTAFMYVSALVLVRFIGKRGLGQLSPFEYLVVIAMGSAAGDPMFYADVPLVHGVLVLAAIVFLQKALVTASERSDSVNHFIEGVPALLVRDGDVLEDALRREGLARDELFDKLREAGISNTAQVRLAYLEPSGGLSVFRVADERHLGQGISTLPAATS
jgi:uncharacterized membrane protein YcaP (DUF421 family)